MPDADSSTDSGGTRDAPKGAGASARSGGILSRLAGLLGGAGDPERAKRRLLREYAKRVQRAHPRLYNHRSSTAEAAMGSLFHGYYRVLGPARILLRNASSSAVLKAVTIERVLSEQQREILRELSPEALTARAEGVDSHELVQEVSERLKAFAAGFDRKTVERARRAYRAVIVLVDLVNYDYWSILRRFDSRYPEADFSYAPRFIPLDADYVTDALKDFLDVIAPVEPDMDWKQALDILKEFRGMELVGAEAWRGLLKTTADLKKSAVLLATVRLIEGDPTYVPLARASEGKLIEPYVATVRTQTEAVLRQLLEAKRARTVEGLVSDVFGGKDLPKLANYTAAAYERHAKKALPGFAYAEALLYVKAYLIELHKTAVKGTVDALLIRGKWREAAMSRSLSDAYQEALGVLGDLVEFDRRLGDNQELGVRLKTVLSRADRAKPQSIVPARQVIDQIDSLAKGYITRVAQACTTIGQLFRALVEDAGKPNPQILSNWQELGGSARGEDVRENTAGVLKRLQALTQLLKLSMGRPAAARAPRAPEPEKATEVPPNPSQ